MKRVVLLCSLGTSANVYVMALKKVCEQQAMIIDCEAIAIAEALSHAKDADLILLSPQVRYNVDKIRDLFPEKTVLLIDSEEFAQLNMNKTIEKLKSLK